MKTEIINTNPKYIENLIKLLSKDSSWRIKYGLCEKIGSVINKIIIFYKGSLGNFEGKLFKFFP
jgi:hypothetical protein